MANEISDIIRFEDWLNHQPSKTAELVANRIALRMLPFWTDFRVDKSQLSNEYSLPFWRLVFIDWVTFLHPSPSTKLKLANVEARKFYAQMEARSTYAKFLTQKTQNMKSEVLASLLYALINQATQIVAADNVAERIWEAVSLDAAALDANRTFEYVAALPLWVGSTPLWARQAWVTFKNFLLRPDLIDNHNHWEVWTDWYEARLDHKPADLDLERKKALLPDVLWQKGAKSVNEAFSRTTQLHLEKIEAEKDQLSLLGLLDAQEIRAALADFEFNQLSNLMRMVPFAEDHQEITDEGLKKRRENMLSEVAEAFSDIVEDIISDGKNVPSSFLSLLRRYSAESGRKLSEVRPGRLWDLGASIHAASLDEDLGYSLGPVISTALENAAEKHLDLIREFFAETLSRQRAVDDLQLIDEVDSDEIIRRLKAGAKAVRIQDWGSVPPPEPEIPAVISEQVEELDSLDLAAQTASEERTRRKRIEAFTRKAKVAAMTLVRYSVSVFKAAGGVAATLVSFQALMPTAFAKAVEAIVALFKNLPWFH